MSAADRYLEIMEILEPDELTVLRVRHPQSNSPSSRREVQKSSKGFSLTAIYYFPLRHQSKVGYFTKGMNYLTAAFHKADTPTRIVVRKLDALNTTLDQELELQKRLVSNEILNVTKKRQKSFDAFGALRTTSPSKRQSLNAC